MFHLVVAVVLRKSGIVIREETAGEDLGLTRDALVDELGLAELKSKGAISLLVPFNSIDQVWVELRCESIYELILSCL